MDKIKRGLIRWGKIQTSAAVVTAALILLNGATVYTEAEADRSVPITEEAVMTYGGTGRSGVTEQRATPGRRSITVTIDGASYSGQAFLYKETTYVGFREFSVALAGAEVSWSDATATATAKTSKTTVTAKRGTEYVVANGRYIWARTGVIIENGTTYVPIRTLTAAFGASLVWDGKNYSVSVTRGSGTIASGNSYYNADEVYWLAKIINAESRGEPLTGKIAVGNVVLNRVKSKDYPNTIYGVIFDKKYGVQFSPVADGSIYLEASEESVIAAKLCLEGYTVSSKILFFINSGMAENFWVTSRPLEVSIGNHDFYA